MEETKPTALVTGATSGIGKAFTERLLAAGWCVYGIGRDFSACSFSGDFHPVPAELSKPTELPGLPVLSDLRHSLDLLVNNAGTARYGPHEELSPSAVSEMVSVNLTAPMILSGMFLRTLKEHSGTILNVSSVTAEGPAVHGAAYGATKAGLSAFSRSLFEEYRKSGVRVINIQPDLTDTALYRNADFTPGTMESERLTAGEVADLMLEAVNARAGLVISELTVRPQKNRILRKKKKADEKNSPGTVSG